MTYRIGGNQVFTDCPEVPICRACVMGRPPFPRTGERIKRRTAKNFGDWRAIPAPNKDKGREPGYGLALPTPRSMDDVTAYIECYRRETELSTVAKMVQC